MSNEIYKNSNLTITSDKIITDCSPIEVMMDWELPMMQEHANIVCHNQGDVLEIGFGLGLSANAIQALNPNSHTIVEIHPQIYSVLETWAVDKPNVTIYNADWFDIQGTLGQYDGIFYDGFGDVRNLDFAQTFVPNHIKAGGKFTYYNDGNGIDSVVDQQVTTYYSIPISPDHNGYFNENIYNVPIVQY
jgi:protein arginine N-methyltransferase 2